MRLRSSNQGFHSDSARKILSPQYLEGNPRCPRRGLRNRDIKQGERLSEHTKRLPLLAIGDCVRIQNQIGHYPLKWDKPGVIIEVNQFDQYAVNVDGSARTTLPNRKFLRKYVPVKSLKTTKTIQDDLWCKNVPATSTFDTKQVSKPTSDTLMETLKTSIL